MTDVSVPAVSDPSQPEAVLGRRALERLDLLLLTLESLDLNGGESTLWATRQLGFETVFPNRVELWKRRCHNPLVTQLTNSGVFFTFKCATCYHSVDYCYSGASNPVREVIQLCLFS